MLWKGLDKKVIRHTLQAFQFDRNAAAFSICISHACLPPKRRTENGPKCGVHMASGNISFSGQNAYRFSRRNPVL